MYTCLGEEKGVEKGEEKVDTIHLLSHYCFGKTGMFRCPVNIVFLELIMKFKEIVYFGVLFPN